MKRLATVTALLVATFVLFTQAGCGGKSIQGEWFHESGNVINIDKDWMTDQQGTQVRYVITGDSALQVTKGSTTEDVRYELDDDTLVITGGGVGGTYYRVGSSAYKTAKAEWDKEQTEKKAREEAAADEERQQEEKAQCEDVRYHVGLAIGKYANGIRRRDLGMSDEDISSDWKRIENQVRSAFAEASSPSDAIDILRSLSGGVEAVTYQYNAASPAPAELNCPSGGTFSRSGWGDDRITPKFKCSVHGEPQ